MLAGLEPLLSLFSFYQLFPQMAFKWVKLKIFAIMEIRNKNLFNKNHSLYFTFVISIYQQRINNLFHVLLLKKVWVLLNTIWAAILTTWQRNSSYVQNFSTGSRATAQLSEQLKKKQYKIMNCAILFCNEIYFLCLLFDCMLKIGSFSFNINTDCLVWNQQNKHYKTFPSF